MRFKHLVGIDVGGRRLRTEIGELISYGNYTYVIQLLLLVYDYLLDKGGHLT